MTRTIAQLLVAAVLAVAVCLLSGGGWALLLVGAAYALSLWVMVLAGTWAGDGPRTVVTRDYALAAVVGTVLGYVFFRVGDDNGSFWAVGFILAGVLLPTATTATRRRGPDGA